MTTTHLRTCPLCEAMCGLEITVDADRVTSVRPDAGDVWSKGYICPKGAVLGELHHDPDRLRRPLLRRDGAFVEVGWDEAFAECERLIAGVLRRHGREAFTAYIGNPTAHNFSLSRYIAAFIPMSGLGPVYSAGTVDQWPKNVSSALLYGGMWTIPTPDIERTDYLIVMGANPAASQGSLLATADVMGKLSAIRERGGKLVVIDPRRTGTAAAADEWISIQPGRDAALLLAWINVLFAENLVRPAHLAERLRGLDELKDAVADFTPEAVADACGIDAATIRRLALELAAAPRASVYGRIGLCNQEFGTLASWLVDVVNILTGNLDREGGAMFADPIAWSFLSLPDPQWAEGFSFGRWNSRVRGAPEILGQYPVSCLAEEIATAGEGQIRGLITVAGNPVLSAPDAGRLDAALPGLECMISVDNWLNETTRHADVILPGLSALEQPHYDEMMWSWATRIAGKYSAPVFAPEGDHPGEWRILLMLAALLQGAGVAEVDVDAFDELFFAGLVDALTKMPGSRIEGRDPAGIVAAAEGEGPERLLDLQIRSGPHGDLFGRNPDGFTLAKMKELPHGIDLGPLTPHLDEVLRTPDGCLDLAPGHILADLPRLRGRLAAEAPDLVLVSRRHLRSNNSWMHNVAKLVAGRDRCTLLVHPDDASRNGLRDGGRAKVTSSAGSVVVPVEVSDEMRPGVVCLPHGWGHDKEGTRLDVASANPGVCSNLLAPGEAVDPLSGNAIVNGLPVAVAPL